MCIRTAACIGAGRSVAISFVLRTEKFEQSPRTLLVSVPVCGSEGTKVHDKFDSILWRRMLIRSMRARKVLVPRWVAKRSADRQLACPAAPAWAAFSSYREVIHSLKRPWRENTGRKKGGSTQRKEETRVASFLSWEDASLGWAERRKRAPGVYQGNRGKNGLIVFLFPPKKGSMGGSFSSHQHHILGLYVNHFLARLLLHHFPRKCDFCPLCFLTTVLPVSLSKRISTSFGSYLTVWRTGEKGNKEKGVGESSRFVCGRVMCLFRRRNKRKKEKRKRKLRTFQSFLQSGKRTDFRFLRRVICEPERESESSCD